MKFRRIDFRLLQFFYMAFIVFLGLLSGGGVDFPYKNFLYNLSPILSLLILFTCKETKFNRLNWLLIVFLFVLAISNGSRIHEYLEFIVILFLFYNNRKPMIISHFLTVSIFLLITCMLSYFGFLPFMTIDTGTYIRHAFVFVHPNHLGQSIFSMMCSFYLICKNKWFKYYDLFIPLGLLLSLFTLFYVTSKTSGALILLLVVFYVFERFTLPKFKSIHHLYSLICKYCWLIPIVLFCAMSFISFVLPTDSAIFMFLSRLLTGRVELQRRAYEIYGIPLFGLNIFSENPYVDSFYYNFILRYGIIFFFAVMGLITYLVHNKCKEGKGELYFPLLLLWTLFGFSEHVALIIYFNPFITYLFDSKEDTSC